MSENEQSDLIENELKKARTSALSGDIETAEKIIYWFQKEVLTKYKTDTHKRIIEEIHKLLAPYVITEYKKNPEKWSSEGHLKHINTYYAHHFNPIDREFYVQNIIKLALNVIEEFKGYKKKYENKNKNLTQIIDMQKKKTGKSDDINPFTALFSLFKFEKKKEKEKFC